MGALVREIAFRDATRAGIAWSAVAADLPPIIQERVSVLLKSAAEPDQALRYLADLRKQQAGAFQRIARSPAALQFLLTVFSYSQFLSEEVLRRPEWIERLPEHGSLHRTLSMEDYAQRLAARLTADPGIDAGTLASYRREELLRILIRDILGYGSLADITVELSNLADAILQIAYLRLRGALAMRHGLPNAGMSIIALGKLGGRELNYSSDIDLMFVYSARGETEGPDSLPYGEFFKRVCTKLTEVLSTLTPHGICYRVDLRLRPEGTLGELCLSLDGARNYYQGRARDWELQMMIKARVAAGEPEPGAALLDFVEPLTYSSTLDFSKVEAVSEARERIHEKLAKRRGAKTEFDVKLAPGGIRDIEFMVQCLQRLHGGTQPWVRHGGTLHALSRLLDKSLLSEFEYGRLASAYQFLRNLEHRLQFDEDRQTHALPSAPERMEALALRMPPAILGSRRSGAALRQQLDGHLAAVRESYERVVHARLPLHYTSEVRYQEDAPASVAAVEAAAPEPVSVNLGLMLAQRAPNLAQALSRSQLRSGARAFEHFLERLLRQPDWLRALDEDPVLAGYLFDIFEHSPFFAEQLNRKPELVEEVRQIRLNPDERTPYGEMRAKLEDPGELRRFFNREMLRIQCESICLERPIFETLARTSELADCAVAAAYQIALRQVVSVQPPVGAEYRPQDQMMVVALGRLGMQEFDLASDADLVFVISDHDGAEIMFWTRVAERMIEILTAYTGDGALFAVDTRLRPNGREGPLVQTEGAFQEYFARTAQAWEGITYMKSRGVAGNLERATQFLSALQDVDWRRYGQSGRSREKLRQMRLRLENEQGRNNPLKASRGGYYDIDFALMYLRLRSAGIFYKVLNTPARVDIIEKMGHLDRADAAFLLDAATFYRALDHALRLSSGHAEGRLPGAQAQLERIAQLVRRWTPEHLNDQPLAVELAQIQRRTREYFDRLFG